MEQGRLSGALLAVLAPIWTNAFRPPINRFLRLGHGKAVESGRRQPDSKARARAWLYRRRRMRDGPRGHGSDGQAIAVDPSLAMDRYFVPQGISG